MANRRLARELALQALFYFDMDKNENNPEQLLDLFRKDFEKKVKNGGEAFFLDLVHGVMEFKPKIDVLLKECSKNWKVSRMSGVDRNIMRIAIFELVNRPDIPSKVSINEALEIAKKYGNSGSASFVNGILDCVRVAEGIE